jgi:TfoX/Sxy family transcriptional regulator of competence genes
MPVVPPITAGEAKAQLRGRGESRPGSGGRLEARTPIRVVGREAQRCQDGHRDDHDGDPQRHAGAELHGRTTWAERSSTAWLSAAVSYDQSMAYDEQLADRIRELVGSEADLTERKMFGGLGFLIGGNMAVAASGQGGVLVRVDPAQSDALVATTNARLMEMRGRQMQGWLRVSPKDLRTKRQLARWVELGMSYARSLPTKR